MALIHVVIPCYKVENFIEQAVLSVINQPYKGIDIVLVDDGSPDDTPRICDELSQKFPSVHVVHQENGGLCAARNAGIDFVLKNLYCADAREFIAFLDADDAWIPNVIDNDLAQHLRTDWKEDVIGFSGVYSNFEMTRFSAPIANEEITNVKGAELIWKAQAVHLGAKLYAIDLFIKWNLRFQHRQKYSEDRIFMLQFYFLAESARMLSRPLYIYRKNKYGIMSTLMKTKAIDHYLPIIDGWRKCNQFLNALVDSTGRHSEHGYTLAAAYLVEMVAEHYRQWGSRKEILSVLSSHPHYSYTQTPKQVNFTTSCYKENRLLFESPIIFELKHRFAGIFIWLAWKIINIPVVAAFWEKHKYPYTQIDYSDK